MDNNTIRKIEHFSYPLPYNKELYELGLIPYRANVALRRKIDELFRSPKFLYRELFIDVSTSGSRQLTNDMARVAIGSCRYYLMYPQQFAHSMENIMMQVIVKMWKQTFRHCAYQEKELDKYYAAKMKLLSIENGLWEELLRVCEENDYIQHGDDMVKKRKGKGLRESNRASMREGSKYFEYLASLE